jgi:putative ABC transport system permease protein
MKDNILKDLISEDLVHNFNLMNTKEINKFVDNYIFAHPDSTITIDNGIPIIVIGLGITPEYIYPLTTVEKINPNVAKEALIFPNSAGYKRIHTSFESNTTENYVACKFIEGLSDNTKTNILDNINVWAKQNFIDAGFDKPAMMFNDTSNIKNASAIRISLIPQLMNTINTISNILVLFILIVSVLVAYIAIVKYIKNQRKSIAILVANGVSKTKIAFSLLPFALLPSIIGGICGYIFGLVLQLPALLMFKSY